MDSLPHSRPGPASESARAPLVASVVASSQRLCPACGRVLTPRQSACSGRCRAILSRRRRATARESRDRKVRALLLTAQESVEAALRSLKG